MWSYEFQISKKKALDVSRKAPVDADVSANGILPTDCGIVDEELKYLTPDFTPKVVNGQDVKRGTIPWQVCYQHLHSIPLDIL